MNEVLIEAKGITKVYQGGGYFSRRHYITALKGADFSLEESEIAGLAGESSCGKTTLAKIIAGIEKPTEGEVRYASHLKLPPDIQMVFQDPFSSLSPNYRTGDLLKEVLSLRYPQAEAKEKAYVLLKEVGLEEEIFKRFPHQLSGGQIQRVALARALAVEAKVIVADEPTSSLDVIAAAAIRGLILDLRKKKKLSFIVISHNLLMLGALADKISVIYRGRIVEVSPASELIKEPLHPYSRLLVQCARRLLPQGEISKKDEEEKGCVFRARCPYQETLCRTSPPLFRRSGRQVACWLYKDWSKNEE
ncbi:MAG: ABC transporter ATP-binding protein [Candidatus Omnitrophica bacterium]|nr:ABC transporter ATP-binding protein [Candidatus Omnitrophota bacterium]